MSEPVKNMTPVDHRRAANLTPEQQVKLANVKQQNNLTKNLPCEKQMKQCPFCPYRYGCPRDLAPHVETLHPAQLQRRDGRVGYLCLYCTEWNSRPRNLRKHMHICHADRFSRQVLTETLKFVCEDVECGQIFYSNKSLQKHQVVKHGQVVEKVKRALDQLYDINRLRQRAEKVTAGDQPTWGQRSTTTKKKASDVSTKRHKSSRVRDCHEACWRKARAGSGFTCSYCDKSFSHHSLCVHHEAHHEDQWKGRKVYTCNHCESTFTTSVLRYQHQHEKHSMLSYPHTHTNCDNRSAVSPPQLTNHQQGAGHNSTPHHQGAGHNSTPQHLGAWDNSTPHHQGAGHNSTPHHQGAGHNSTPQHQGAGNNSTAHHQGTGHNSTPQNQGARDNSTSHHHGAGHNFTPCHQGAEKKEQRFLCGDCGKVYKQRSSLNAHRDNHHNPQPKPRGSRPATFECKICSVRLTSHSGYKTHMYRHNGIRPFACRYCSQTFTSQNHHMAHENIHTGKKDHRCPLCYKVFTNTGTLYNHLYKYKVHGEVSKDSLKVVSGGKSMDALLQAAQLCQETSQGHMGNSYESLEQSEHEEFLQSCTDIVIHVEAPIVLASSEAQLITAVEEIKPDPHKQRVIGIQKQTSDSLRQLVQRTLQNEDPQELDHEDQTQIFVLSSKTATREDTNMDIDIQTISEQSEKLPTELPQNAEYVKDLETSETVVEVCSNSTETAGRVPNIGKLSQHQNPNLEAGVEIHHMTLDDVPLPESLHTTETHRELVFTSTEGATGTQISECSSGEGENIIIILQQDDDREQQVLGLGGVVQGADDMYIQINSDGENAVELCTE